MKIRSPRLKYTHFPAKAKMMTEHPAWHLKNLAFYDSMLFLHYADEVPPLKAFLKGDHRVPHAGSNKSLETEQCKGCCVGCYDD